MTQHRIRCSIVVPFIIGLLLAGCAGRNNKVIIDPAGVDMARYQQDLTQCEALAEQVEQRATGGALGGALISGLVGAALGDSRLAQRAAGAGAVIGGAKGLSATAGERRVVVRNCLLNRGYRVLN